MNSLLINDDIEAIIHRGEERTAEMNSKYEGLSFDDLSNFKSDSSVQQWEGEDFRAGVCGRYASSQNKSDFVSITAEDSSIQPVGTIEARAEAELFSGCLFQGIHAGWLIQDGKGAEAPPCTQTASDVSREYLWITTGMCNNLR